MLWDALTEAIDASPAWTGQKVLGEMLWAKGLERMIKMFIYRYIIIYIHVISYIYV